MMGISLDPDGLVVECMDHSDGGNVSAGFAFVVLGRVLFSLVMAGD